MDSNPEPPPQGEQSIGRRMVRGSIWSIARLWALHGIGIVSTLVLARLLVPADFGVIAMAMIVVGFLEIFGEAGIDLTLIQNQRATRDHYDTAWTFRIILGFALALLLVAIAPLAAAYFDEPRVAPVMQVLALRAVIVGFENVGVIAFRKELDFAKDFRFSIYRRLGTVAVTLLFAAIMRNYWALVVGMVVGPLIGVVLSYGMHPFRPRLSLRATRDVWSFSIWIIGKDIGYFFHQRIDTFAVASFSGATVAGGYYIANDLSMQVAQNVAMPLGRALLPGYAKIAHDREQIARLYLNSLAIVAVITLPLGFGMAEVAENLVAVLLGAKWTMVAPLLQVLGLFAVALSLSGPSGPLLIAIGRVRTVAGLQWFEILCLAPLLLAAGYYGTTMDIALARAAFSFVLLLLILVIAGRTLALRFMDFARVLWRPCLGVAVMSAPVLLLREVAFSSPLLGLAVQVGAGAVAYTGAVLFLWLVSGRPEGPESYVLRMLGNLTKKTGPATP